MAVSLHLLGKRIKEARRARNMSQEKLAELANISLSHMSKIERGKNQAALDTLGLISDALDVPVEWIISGASIPENTANNRQFGEIAQDCDPETVETMLDICERIKSLRQTPLSE